MPIEQLTTLNFIKRYWPALGWAIFTLIACGVNGSSLPHVEIEFFQVDKLAHIVLFGTQAWLIMYCSHGREATVVNWPQVHRAVLLSALYGVLIEFLQYAVFVNRSYDYADMLADAIGAALCYAFFPRYIRLK